MTDAHARLLHARQPANVPRQSLREMARLNGRAVRRPSTSTASARLQGLASLAQAGNDPLTRRRERLRLFHHALADAVGVCAFLLNVVPARVGDALHAVERLLQAAGDPVQAQLAALAQLVVMRMHADQYPALAAGDVAAELADVGRAGLLHRLDCGGDAFTDVGLSRYARGRPDQCQCRNGEDSSFRGRQHGLSPFSKVSSDWTSGRA